MVEAEGLTAIAAELENMSPAHRQQVLAALTPTEGDVMARLLFPEPEGAESLPAERFENHFSPWLAARLGEADQGGGAMTSMTRHLVLRLAREVMEESGNSPRPRVSRRSLLQVLSDALKVRAAS